MEVLFGLALYLLPTIVALVRKRPNPGVLIAINVLLGWTLIGWVVAFFMAAKTPRAEEPKALELAKPLDPGETLTASGAGGTMTFDGRDVTITRKGGLSFVIHGLAGEKVIPIYSIQAVQLRRAKYNVRGFLQLSVMGGLERQAGAISAASDENSVLFDVADEPAFERLAGVLREAIHSARAPQVQTAMFSAADELTKFAALRDSGAITAEEYAAQKELVLGMGAKRP